ncbi:2-hydroxyhepta-2,4-diene-1,7-dioate isomerase [Halobacteriales archaeon QS_8_69_73]|nr:MAG: 2-hydroxyhepta-2,4-diene-1,7-dioate isomerase [Halobacteriales archaeon QS_8_69_73]
MRFVRFRDPNGDVRGGEWTGEDGAEIRAYPVDGRRYTVASERYAAADVELLPPTVPSKIVCVGLNYADHAAEQDEELPDRPLLFLKPPNALASHGATIELPAGKDRLDYEAELGVVVGERCRDVDAAEAASVVAGYTCVDDLSNRDDQRVETNWVRGKAFDGAAPIGPVVASPDEVPADAAVRCRVNGDLRQDSSRSEFIFSVPELLAEITSYMTLEPGDVVSTGTPAGVGPLSDGDSVEVTVEGVGTLRHDVTIP